MKQKVTFLFAVLFLVRCGDNDPEVSKTPSGVGVVQGYACVPKPPYYEDISGCLALSIYYQPRVNGSADDSWPACISDDNIYHRIDPTISTIARVEAFEQIAALLFGRIPSAEDFVNARVIYAQDQGLDSRVQRRHDIHYPAPSGGGRCNDPGVPDANPDRCVGPVSLLPILNDAFAKGALGEAPLYHAARIEAALLWFLYVSVLSEIDSCAVSSKDCDSAWAYYSGGTPRGSPIGLGRYINSLAPGTHDAAYDGVLATRCWRDLDSTATASNLTLRGQAIEQVDRAMLRGLVMLFRQKFLELNCSSDDYQVANLAFLQTWAPLLDRVLRERDVALADLVEEDLSQVVVTMDIPGIVTGLDSQFSCP